MLDRPERLNHPQPRIRQEDECGRDSRFAVLVLGVDGSKAVIDVAGHHVGDELLQLLADRTRRCARSADLVALQRRARLRHCAVGQLPVERVNSLNARLEATLITVVHAPGLRYHVSVSIGAATADTPVSFLEVASLGRTAAGTPASGPCRHTQAARQFSYGRNQTRPGRIV